MATSTVTAETEVDAPIRAVYDQWTQFEEFPRFMSAVERIEQLGDRRQHWVVKVGGVEREFDATITDQVPDDHIAWASDGEAVHSGRVSFQSLGDRTKVALEMTWRPETFTEKTGAALGIDEHAVKKDFERFKDFIEERGRETGGWRGEIHGGTTTP
ncbi:SRPBCC family protein [Microbacterium sp. LWH7-1.2]|uniref:SRPBCC family protein n=1 Tax=Microbacterium sp. LWH7-1.2 TaxID=3135257 RepID=UPI0031397479